MGEHGRVDELRLLAGPGRVFTTAGARVAGYRPNDLRRLVRSGAITRSVRGGMPWALSTPWMSVIGSARRLRKPAMPAARSPVHYSELLRLGLPHFHADLHTVHLTRVRPATARRRTGVAIHPMPTMTLTTDGRIPPALAIVQAGIVCGPMASLIAADAALNRQLITTSALDDALDAVRGSPGTALIGSFLALADGRAQSPGETRLRHAFHLMRCPVIPQARITDGVRTAYVDFLLEEHPVCVEFDGLVKYGACGLRPGQAELIAEKDREDWLRGLGYQVVRAIWTDLDDLVPLAGRIAGAIRRASPGRFGSGPLWPLGPVAPSRPSHPGTPEPGPLGL